MRRQKSISIQNRMLIFAIAVVIMLAALLLRVVWIQVVRGDEYSKSAALQQTKDVVISSKRGMIYDRNMNELAKSASAETVTANPSEVKESGKLDEVAEGLAKILDMDKSDIRTILSKNQSYVEIKEEIDKEQADMIRKKGYPGIALVEDFKRYYPGGTLASHVIGFVGKDNQGLAGIEMIYENYLKGVPGRLITAKDAIGTNMPYQYEKYIDPENGINVVLTIDEVVQRKAEDILKKTSENFDVENGASCIIMDAKNGEILAMATYPNFDLNAPFTIMDEDLRKEIRETEDDNKRNKSTSDALNKQWRNKAVVDSYEPGSTFKGIVAAMALEENLVSLNENFVCNGYVHIADYDIGCWNTSGHGTETFVQGVYNSCNPVFMSVGARLGASRFYKYYKAFGFGETTGFDLPGEATGTFHAMKNFNEVELATASFGQGFTVTPLQLITAYSAITNEGYMVKPRLIKSLVDDDGNVIKSFDKEIIRQVISRETAQSVCQVLEGVASDGTSKNAYIEGYQIAGKTGTSEKIPRGNGKYVASFIGFAPADDPELICLIAFDEPMGYSHAGGTVAAPAFKEIMQDVLVYLQVESDSSIEYNFVPDVKGKSIKDAKNAVIQAGLHYKVVGKGDEVVSQSPAVGVGMGGEGVVILYTEKNEGDMVMVPDLSGCSAADANARLINAGLNMKVRGSGATGDSVHVGSQSPKAGEEVPRGTVVTVEYTSADIQNSAEAVH